MSYKLAKQSNRGTRSFQNSSLIKALNATCKDWAHTEVLSTSIQQKQLTDAMFNQIIIDSNGESFWDWVKNIASTLENWKKEFGVYHNIIQTRRFKYLNSLKPPNLQNTEAALNALLPDCLEKTLLKNPSQQSWFRLMKYGKSLNEFVNDQK